MVDKASETASSAHCKRHQLVVAWPPRVTEVRHVANQTGQRRKRDRAHIPLDDLVQNVLLFRLP